MTVPNQQSQEALVRQACRDAGIRPSDVRYVEAHGTGTLVGDPIEARALGTVLSEGRPPGSHCLLGSVKTNIGHLEPASGAAGLIKAALVLKRCQVPANLHFHEPNPEIDFEGLRLRVPRELEPLPAGERPAFAGVNSFGFGGTNAHVLLEEPPRSDVAAPNGQAHGEPCAAAPRLLPLSARSPGALQALAQAYVEFLEGPQSAGVSLDDLCFTASLRRSHHDHRLAVVTHAKSDLQEQLKSWIKGDRPARSSCDRVASGPRPGLAMVFSGQGPQWWAMGRELLRDEPEFRRTVERCDQVLKQLADWSLVDELTADQDRSRIKETAIAQPALFAIQVALAAVWRSWGITPDVVIGHSVGEVAAAHIAGILCLEDAVRVVFHRSRCMDLAPTRGRMLAASLSVQQAEEAIASCRDRISIAAINSPNSITLSGDAEALAAVEHDLQQRKIFCKALQVDYAFHSPLLEPVKDELLRALGAIKPQPARAPFISTVTGQRVEGPELDSQYWWQNFRMPVQFAQAMERLLETPCGGVLEISPHPVLAASIAECFQLGGQKVRVVASLKRQEAERAMMLQSLGALYTLGASLDWQGVAPAGRFVRLPAYPWQHTRYWQECEESHRMRVEKAVHPLLGSALREPCPSWEKALDPRQMQFLEDHRFQGHVLYPMTAYLEMAVAAGNQVFQSPPQALEEVKLSRGCFLPDGHTKVLQTVVNSVDSTFRIYSRAQGSDAAWSLHSSGILRRRQGEPKSRRLNRETIQRRCLQEVPRDEYYRRLREFGLEYGPAFQGIQGLWRGAGESLAQIDLPADELGNRFHFHPALLDACVQAFFGAIPEAAGGKFKVVDRVIYLPVEIADVQVHGRPGVGPLWSHARLTRRNQQELVGDIEVFDETGLLFWEAHGLRCKAVDGPGDDPGMLDDLLYEYRWEFQPDDTAQSASRNCDFYPCLPVAMAAVQAKADRRCDQENLASRNQRFERDTDKLCAAYVWSAFEQLGAELQPGQRFTRAELIGRLSIAAQHHHRLLDRFLGWMEEDGILARLPGKNEQEAANPTSALVWQVLSTPETVDPLRAWPKLVADHPSFFAELQLIGRCGEQLANVLCAEVDPLQLIFPDGSLSTAEHLYRDAPRCGSATWWPVRL